MTTEVRAGLRYETETGLNFCFFEPDGPFVVDGIHYSHSRLGCHTRPMVELHFDHICEESWPDECHGGSWRMNHADPPTEEELDHWVHAKAPLGGLLRWRAPC